MCHETCSNRGDFFLWEHLVLLPLRAGCCEVVRFRFVHWLVVNLQTSDSSSSTSILQHGPYTFNQSQFDSSIWQSTLVTAGGPLESLMGMGREDQTPNSNHLPARQAVRAQGVISAEWDKGLSSVRAAAPRGGGSFCSTWRSSIG